MGGRDTKILHNDSITKRRDPNPLFQKFVHLCFGELYYESLHLTRWSCKASISDGHKFPRVKHFGDHILWLYEREKINKKYHSTFTLLTFPRLKSVPHLPLTVMLPLEDPITGYQIQTRVLSHLSTSVFKQDPQRDNFASFF